MADYDPQVIRQFADRLYARGVLTILVSAVLGVLIGFVGTSFIMQSIPYSLTEKYPEWIWIWIWPTLLGLIGVVQGLERAASQKLQAQVALCQLQIELNTRKKHEGTEI